MDDRTHEAATWETSRIIWRNKTWAVTSYGMENVAGPYHYYIEKERLRQQDWPEHVGAKTWVDAEDFREAFEKALERHDD